MPSQTPMKSRHPNTQRQDKEAPMKQPYSAPDLHIVCFAPVERLAGTILFDDLLNISKPGLGGETEPSGDDIPVEIDL